MCYVVHVKSIYFGTHQCPTSNQTNLFQGLALSTKSLIPSRDEGDIGAPSKNNNCSMNFSFFSSHCKTNVKEIRLSWFFQI
jgi:hypothetical protein